MSEHVAEGLSLLLPLYNQAGAVEQAISAWSALLEKLDRPYEIIIINDGSTDSTEKLLHGAEGKSGLISRIPHLQVVAHAQRRGFGASIRTALSASRFPLIFYTGCDHAYNPADLKKLLPRLNEVEPFTGKKVEIVTGFRTTTAVNGWRKSIDRLKRFFLRIVLGIELPPSLGSREANNRGYSFLLWALFGLRVADVDSKFKLIRKRIFERIPIQSDGEFVHAEILAKANFLVHPIAEEPITNRNCPFNVNREPLVTSSRSKELWRVFLHPDFGPPFIPSTTEPCATLQQANQNK